MEISLQTIPPPLPDLEGAPAHEILSWAIRAFFPDVAVACSMQDCVVVDLAVRIEPRIEVFFLDTGFHFPETLETARQLRRRYRLNLVELRPEDDAAVYARDGHEACCAARKVAPMERYLEGKRAWVTGIRRAESPSRADARAVEWDARRGLVKVNPIVAWTDEDVTRYVADHDLIVNPLRFRGYDSIGCAPCTRPGWGRDGRWADTDKLECGLHTWEPPLGIGAKTARASLPGTVTSVADDASTPGGAKADEITSAINGATGTATSTLSSAPATAATTASGATDTVTSTVNGITDTLSGTSTPGVTTQSSAAGSGGADINVNIGLH